MGDSISSESDAKQEKIPEKVSLFQPFDPFSARSHALQIADMIRAIGENGTPLVDGYAARHAIEIILCIYKSAQAHKEVILQ